MKCHFHRERKDGRRNGEHVSPRHASRLLHVIKLFHDGQRLLQVDARAALFHLHLHCPRHSPSSNGISMSSGWFYHHDALPPSSVSVIALSSFLLNVLFFQRHVWLPNVKDVRHIFLWRISQRDPWRAFSPELHAQLRPLLTRSLVQGFGNAGFGGAGAGGG